jgi:hypothetical protein
MGIPFSPRAALCTLVVVVGFGAAVAAQMPGGLFGLIVWERDGLLTIDGGGTLREDDSREIVTAVLAHEARRGDRGAVCVQLADEGEALASERQEIGRMQRAVEATDPATRAPLSSPSLSAGGIPRGTGYSRRHRARLNLKQPHLPPRTPVNLTLPRPLCSALPHRAGSISCSI